MKNNFLQLAVSTILIILAVVILNPFHLWMPDMAHMMLLAGLLVFFAIFAAFILREQAHDEREVWMRMLSGRIGYLAGATVLVVGIAIQGLRGVVDPWLISALLLMLLAKLGTNLYLDNK